MVVKGFLNEKCKVQIICTERIFLPTFDRRWASLRHRRRYRHSGILASIVLVGYRTGSTYSSTGLFPALIFFFRCRLDWMLYPPASNFCSSFPAFLLSHWSIFQCTLYNKCLFNGRLSGQFSGSQAAFGTTFRGRIGYRKAGKTS